MFTDAELYGYLLYAVTLLTMGGIYAVAALGLNIQWGFTGLFNAGVAGFFAVGAYIHAILTTSDSTYINRVWDRELGQMVEVAAKRHLGGFDLPIPVGIVAAMIASAVIGYFVARICIRLRSDYLAIATIGIAEILRLVFTNETELTNGPRGVSEVPKAFEGLAQPYDQFAFLAMILVFVLLIYFALERAQKSPWGRTMTAIRENEQAAAAAGKDVERFRLQSFVIGAAFMGLAGALLAQFTKFVDPKFGDPLRWTFLVWVMMVVGGAANNRGAILGAFLMWTVWSATELITAQLPTTPIQFDLFGYEAEVRDLQIRFAYLRIFLIGLILQFVLQLRPQGLLPERRPDPPPSPAAQRSPP